MAFAIPGCGKEAVWGWGERRGGGRGGSRGLENRGWRWGRRRRGEALGRGEGSGKGSEGKRRMKWGWGDRRVVEEKKGRYGGVRKGKKGVVGRKITLDR